MSTDTRTTKQIAAAFLAVAYVAGSIATFGAVWHRQECPPVKGRFVCETDFRVAGAIVASVFWPFTVSAILQEPRP